MADVGILEAKTHFSEWVERVRAGQEVTITRHGRPVAKLVPVAPVASNAEARREQIRRLKELRDRIPWDGKPIPWQDLKNAGRR